MLSVAWRTSHSHERGSCCIKWLSRAFDAGPNERILDSTFHHEIDRPTKQFRQGIAEVLICGDAGVVAGNVSDQQVDIRSRRVKVRTASGRAKHVQPMDLKSLAEFRDVDPTCLDQSQHWHMVSRLAPDILPQLSFHAFPPQ